ncbi:hypothetical protein G6F65_019223 [Rhizopus arrhizus]|nr:hypothetical protein G6F65_019223 [Rhizopus arrhizus]
MVSLLKKLIGSRNDRLLKQYRKLVTQINGQEPKISALSDAELAAKTDEFRSRYAQGTTLDDLLPEAFAVVREAGKRRQDRRNAHGGRQDADGHVARLPERGRRQGRARGDGERLPGPPRR